MLQLRARSSGTLTREPKAIHPSRTRGTPALLRTSAQEPERIPHSVDSPIGLPLVELPVKFRVLWAVQPVNALFSVLRLMSVKLGTRSGGRS
jgi:hypothetical protein